MLFFFLASPIPSLFRLVGGDINTTRSTAAGGGGVGRGLGRSMSGSVGLAPDVGFSLAIATLRSGIKSVSATSPNYPSLWRELLASLVAMGAGKKEVTEAFRGAAEACDPSGGTDEGVAQGEFLAGYLRWSGAVEGIDAARRALQWAKRSFLLAGTGAAAAYREAIELEIALGWAGGKRGEERAKRVRELFEVRWGRVYGWSGGVVVRAIDYCVFKLQSIPDYCTINTTMFFPHIFCPGDEKRAAAPLGA